MSVVTTPAILLRSHPYSETSQILRFFTRDRGVVSTLARGVRKEGGRRGGSLSTFSEGHLTFQEKEGRELQSYRDFAAERSRLALSRDPHRFAGASVLGELVLQHAGGEGNPPLFHRLSAGLDHVESVEGGKLIQSLLLELWALVVELGYAPEIQACVECGRALAEDEMGRFDFPAGGIRCPDCQEEGRGPRLGPVARRQLAGLLDGRIEEGFRRPRAHLRLVNDFITYHISGGLNLRSMEVLANLIPADDA